MVPPARPSETQRSLNLSTLFDVPPDSDCKTKAMKSSSSRPMQEFEQSLRTILHAHAPTAAGAASLCGCLFAGNQVCLPCYNSERFINCSLRRRQEAMCTYTVKAPTCIMYFFHAERTEIFLICNSLISQHALDFYPTAISFIVSYDTSRRLNLNQSSVVSKIAGRGDPQAHNLRCRCRLPFKRGEE